MVSFESPADTPAMPGMLRKSGAFRGMEVEIRRETDCLLEGDGFELPVREHRAMAPSHGFAAASHREAALREAPASHGETAFRGAAGFREARRRTEIRRCAGRGERQGFAVGEGSTTIMGLMAVAVTVSQDRI